MHQNFAIMHFTFNWIGLTLFLVFIVFYNTVITFTKQQIILYFTLEDNLNTCSTVSDCFTHYPKITVKVYSVNITIF